ncbi:hypothetical protein ABXT70_13790 [Candidatus Njordibacter sp. Uisw_039]|jgi:hypothetical protein|uniref:hypothetical protein n=1 Tax=Candidatus Njordibacter sp. Uisw_039 TaxID=3230972 RepID=UPI003D4FC0AA
MIFETVTTLNGQQEIQRVKTSFILLCGFSFIPLGLYLVIAHEIMFGVALIIFFAPCFILYPMIRFFISGGRDSVAAIVTTVVVEELIKSEIKKSSNKRKC